MLLPRPRREWSPPSSLRAGAGPPTCVRRDIDDARLSPPHARRVAERGVLALLDSSRRRRSPSRSTLYNISKMKSGWRLAGAVYPWACSLDTPDDPPARALVPLARIPLVYDRNGVRRYRIFGGIFAVSTKTTGKQRVFEKPKTTHPTRAKPTESRLPIELLWPLRDTEGQGRRQILHGSVSSVSSVRPDIERV